MKLIWQSGASFTGGCALCPLGFISVQVHFIHPTQKSTEKSLGAHKNRPINQRTILSMTVRVFLTSGINMILQNMNRLLLSSRRVQVVTPLYPGYSIITRKWKRLITRWKFSFKNLSPKSDRAFANSIIKIRIWIFWPLNVCKQTTCQEFGLFGGRNDTVLTPFAV